MVPFRIRVCSRLCVYRSRWKSTGAAAPAPNFGRWHQCVMLGQSFGSPCVCSPAFSPFRRFLFLPASPLRVLQKLLKTVALLAKGFSDSFFRRTLSSFITRCSFRSSLRRGELYWRCFYRPVIACCLETAPLPAWAGGG